MKRGRVAKLVDALDLGSCEEARGGSIPFTPTIYKEEALLSLFFVYEARTEQKIKFLPSPQI